MEILGQFDINLRRALKEIDPNYDQHDALVICGTTPEKDITEADAEILIEKIRHARESGRPFLGICFGHQLTAIEVARSRGVENATSEEFGKGTFVVRRRPKLRVGLYGGETWWSNYETFTDWQNPPHFITVPYHPEYQSFKCRPHKVLTAFLKICTAK